MVSIYVVGFGKFPSQVEKWAHVSESAKKLDHRGISQRSNPQKLKDGII